MSEKQLQIKQTEIVNDFLLIQWTDETDSVISLSRMRDNCPCAACEGEKDALGNIYKGPPQRMTEQSYQLKGLKPVGYYGLQPYWADGHNTGIYTISYLKILSAEN